eukprot:GILJ01004880.1.p1 GENE.GILJ01004880.1~~GILJ01004880.1.p1  ORF type:complete len:545 (+),score=57.33 GILJ01004880.1:139-1773(+)
MATAEELKSHQTPFAVPGNSAVLTDSYEIRELLGSGSFGTVVKGIHKPSRLPYAIKIMNKKSMSDDGISKLRKEAQILRSLDHCNIVRFKEMMETDSHIYIVMEYVPGGQLLDQIAARGKFSEAEASQIVKYLFSAVNHIHEKDIVHRDLKPENILLENLEDLSTVKIADFGLSGQFENTNYLQRIKGTAGTLIYMAPEALTHSYYSKSVDIWSCGIITYILCVGTHPYYIPSDTKESYLGKVQQNHIKYPPHMSENARNLVSHLLNNNPSERYTAKEALNHPWITGEHSREGIPTVLEMMRSYNAQRKLRKAIYTVWSATAIHHAIKIPLANTQPDPYRNFIVGAAKAAAAKFQRAKNARIQAAMEDQSPSIPSAAVAPKVETVVEYTNPYMQQSVPSFRGLANGRHGDKLDRDKLPAIRKGSIKPAPPSPVNYKPMRRLPDEPSMTFGSMVGGVPPMLNAGGPIAGPNGGPRRLSSGKPHVESQESGRLFTQLKALPKQTEHRDALPPRKVTPVLGKEKMAKIGISDLAGVQRTSRRVSAGL